MKTPSIFLLNFLSLNVSSFIIKILNFILFIFIVHTLSIKDYGVYVLVWAQVNFFTPLLDFGTTSYGLVYMSEDKKNQLNALLSLRIVIASFIFLFSIFTGFIYGSDKTLSFFIFLTSFSILGNVMYGSQVIVTSLKDKAYFSSIFSLLFTAVLLFSSIVPLTITKNLSSIFYVIFIMYSINAVMSWILIKKSFPSFRFTYHPVIWKEIASKSYVFIVISFLLGIYFKIDIFLLNFLKSQKEVGIYSAGYKFFEAFLFIVASYNISATHQLSKLHKESFTKFIYRVYKDSILLAVLGFLIAVFIYLIAPFFMPFILKQDTNEASRVLQIVIFSLPLMLLATVFTNVLFIFKKAHLVIFIFMFQVITNFLLNLYFIPKYSYIGSAYITVLSELINAVLVFCLFLYYKKNENQS